MLERLKMSECIPVCTAVLLQSTNESINRFWYDYSTRLDSNTVRTDQICYTKFAIAPLASPLSHPANRIAKKAEHKNPHENRSGFPLSTPMVVLVVVFVVSRIIRSLASFVPYTFLLSNNRVDSEDRRPFANKQTHCSWKNAVVVAVVRPCHPGRRFG
jgi:hypothetical protein